MEVMGVAGCEALYCTMMVGPKKTRDGGGDGDGKSRGRGRGSGRFGWWRHWVEMQLVTAQVELRRAVGGEE
jgi:hypothetical protein